MLPNCPSGGAAQLSLKAGRRYVDFTIRDLARQFDSLGVNRREIEVKLFGGGDVLMFDERSLRPTVGKLNCESALKVLEDEGFAVTASSLGGNSGVHIEFNTESGEVVLRRLS
jgi:chemotaxis protein CheD